MKREADRVQIDGVLAATGSRPIVEVSARDAWWGAQPTGNRYEGNNVLGRLWMELSSIFVRATWPPATESGPAASASAALPGAMAFRPPPFRRHPSQPHSRHPVSPTRASLPEDSTDAANTRPRPRG